MFIFQVFQNQNMNLFWLDHDVKKCAQMHCDKHCVKMILEMAQLLSTAHRVIDGIKRDEVRHMSNGKRRKYTRWFIPDARDELLYSATHVNHPCALWVRESDANYMLTYHLFVELCKEYTRRYKKVHLCETKLLDALSGPPYEIKFSPTVSDPPQVMPDAYKVPGDAVRAYRNYYMGDKRGLATWAHSSPPQWFN